MTAGAASEEAPAPSEAQSASGENGTVQPSDVGSGQNEAARTEGAVQESSAEQAQVTDSASVWILLLASVLCLLLGFILALVY